MKEEEVVGCPVSTIINTGGRSSRRTISAVTLVHYLTLIFTPMSATIVHPQTADSVLVLERVSSTATLSSTTANYVPSNSQIVQPTDEAFMKEAIDLSIHSVKMGGGPFGAVIVDGNNTVVGRGHNQVRARARFRLLPLRTRFLTLGLILNQYFQLLNDDIHTITGDSQQRPHGTRRSRCNKGRLYQCQVFQTGQL